MTISIYAGLLLIGYGVLSFLILLGIFVLYAATDEIIRYLTDKPRKKNYEWLGIGNGGRTPSCTKNNSRG